MEIYNTLSKRIENFKTAETGVLKMYVCGPTVYNYIHIGNARPVVFYDVVRRYFESIGYEVRYVSNVTDVNDKIYQKSLEKGLDEFVYANEMTEAFLEDVGALNCKNYYRLTKVTEYMQAIINFVSSLLEKGYAYKISNGDIYFRIDKAKDYGHLSGQVIGDLIQGARVNVNEELENPLDFVLWKHETIGHVFEAPFGSGRPGWHTECVCMIQDVFGGKIDIHGGGTDLRFPHHENERAQSIVGYGHDLATYWVHNARVDFKSQKMSKSIGNTVTVKDILKTSNANSLRLLLLSSNYRQTINYSEELLQSCEKENEKIARAYKQAFVKLDLEDAFTETVDKNIITDFNSAFEDDLNISNAMTVLQANLKEINRLVRQDDISNLAISFATFCKLLLIFGLEYEVPRMSEEDKKVYHLWEEARKKKDFSKADIYRKQLLDKGIL